ncbi:MAG: sugar ABC transporter permease, partial [Marinitoga sp. 4572_148]
MERRTYNITYFQRKKEKIVKISIYIILIFMSLPIILSYLWLILSSFSKGMKYGIIPTNLTLEHWRFLWESVEGYPNIWSVTFNTFLVAFLVMAFEVFVSSFAGYALSRFKFRGRVTIL